MLFEHIEDQTYQPDELFLDLAKLYHFENCQFNACSFANTSLASYQFTDCVFTSCDLSNSNLLDTNFAEVNFIDCKLLGLNFDACNPLLLQMSFESSNLSYSVFQNLKLKPTLFKHCNLTEVDFTQTQLSESRFIDCQLFNTVFQNALLESTQLIDCLGINVDICNNYVKGMALSLNSVEEFLSQYGISIINE